MPSRADSPRQTPPRPGPHGLSGRRLLIVAALAALSGDALGIVATAPSQTYFDNSADAYKMFAATCPVATGSTTVCGTNPGLPETTLAALKASKKVLFVWGDYGDQATVGRNMTMSWTNDLKGPDGTETFAIKTTAVHLTTADGDIGTPPGGVPTLGQNSISQPNGQGISGAWELLTNASRPEAVIGDSRVQVINRWTGPNFDRFSWWSDPKTAADNQLVGDSTQTWVNLTNHTTESTPIDRTYQTFDKTTSDPEDYRLDNGQDLQIRLFVTNPKNGETLPDAVVSALKVAVTYSRADLQGTLDFGQVRVGTTSEKGASIWNETDAQGGFRALEVTAGAATGAIVGAGQYLVDQMDPGDKDSANTDAKYVYTPSALKTGPGPITPTDDSAIIAVTSPDALDITFTAIGQAVGPVFDLSGDDVDGATIDMGEVNINDPGDPNRITQLIIKNLFEANGWSEDLTNLGLMKIGLTAAAYKPGAELKTKLDVFELTDLPADGYNLKALGVLGGLPFNLKFNPDTVKSDWNVWLTFITDVGVANDAAGGQAYSFLVTGSSSGAAPLPGTLALLGLGLAGLASRRGHR